MSSSGLRNAPSTGWHLLLCAALGACSTLPASEPWPVAAVHRVQLDQVAYFPQEQFQCGPASLASTLSYSGVALTPHDLSSQVYLPGREGSLQLDIMGAVRRAARLPYPITPQPSALLAQLAGGQPVLVLQNLGWAWWPRWHYAVVIGYDQDQQTVTLRSGDQATLVMPMADFDQTWRGSQRWGLVVAVPDHLPVGAIEADWLKTAAAMEPIAPQMAEQAYRTALVTWPRAALAQLGLGNLAWARHDLAQAGHWYRQLVTDHPSSADGWNNLAQVLWQQGAPSDARDAVEQAIGLGGPHLAIYLDTRNTMLHNPLPAPRVTAP